MFEDVLSVVSIHSLSDVTYLSNGGVSAEPLQRADQLSGRCRWCQLWRRLSVSSGRTEDRPTHPGWTAHAQWPRHGAGRPRHWGHIQDGQAVTQDANYGQEQEDENPTNLWMERNKGQDVPSPSLHGHPAVWPRPRLREALWNDAPPKANREKDIQWLAGEWRRCRFEWDWSLSAFASLLCLQCIITCHIYSKRRTFDFFFFSYPL